jgi:hypothetical protein
MENMSLTFFHGILETGMSQLGRINSGVRLNSAEFVPYWIQNYGKSDLPDFVLFYYIAFSWQPNISGCSGIGVLKFS